MPKNFWDVVFPAVLGEVDVARQRARHLVHHKAVIAENTQLRVAINHDLPAQHVSQAVHGVGGQDGPKDLDFRHEAGLSPTQAVDIKARHVRQRAVLFSRKARDFLAKGPRLLRAGCFAFNWGVALDEPIGIKVRGYPRVVVLIGRYRSRRLGQRLHPSALHVQPP